MYVETTSSSGVVGGIVKSFWKKTEALEKQEWENFVLNFRKKKMEPVSLASIPKIDWKNY